MQSLHRTIPILLLTVLVAAGCATRFVEPEVAAPHGVLQFPSQQEQQAARLFIEPQEFGGVPRPRQWMAEAFRVPPGELELLVRAARENQQGGCLLRFAVAAGETYRIEAEAAVEAFILRARHDGESVAECRGDKTLLPTPMGIPGIIPRHWSARSPPAP